MRTIDISKLTQKQLDNYFVLSAKQNDELTEFWLELGANIKGNESVIMYAIENGNEDLLDTLLKVEDVDVNAIVNGVPVWFYSLCDMKYLDKFRSFNLNIHRKKKGQITALEWAYDFDALDVADALIEIGADPNEITHHGMTLIAWIIEQSENGESDIKWFDKLIKAGADINKSLIIERDFYILEEAIRWRGLNDAIINKALEAGIDLNLTKAVDADPVLMRFSDYDTLKELIRYGADVNAKNSNGMTVLEYHIGWVIPTDSKVIELLLENGADPIALCGNGRNHLNYARKMGNKEAVKLIKKYLKK